MILGKDGRVASEEFERVAEATRMRVQELIAEESMLADQRGELPAPELAAMFWAQLSGVVTAAANGLAGLCALSIDPSRADTLRQALHDQLDSAFSEALSAREAGR